MRTAYMRRFGKPWGGFVQALRMTGRLEKNKLTTIAAEIRTDPEVLTDPTKRWASLAKLTDELIDEFYRLAPVFSAVSFVLSELSETSDKVNDFLDDLLDWGVITQDQKHNLHLLFEPLESCKRQVWWNRQKLGFAEFGVADLTRNSL